MARSQNTDAGARDDVPNDPTDLSGGSWLAAARRALKEYKADDLQDRAAALTYFGIQSIFPGLLVLISLLGIVGKSATQPLITNLGKALPSSVRSIIMSDITHLQQSHTASGILGIAGIVARPVVSVELCRGLHARLQRHLRRPRGPADLENRADPPGRHRGDDDPARGGGRHRGRDRRPGTESRECARARLDSGHGLGHRQVARAADHHRR